MPSSIAIAEPTSGPTPATVSGERRFLIRAVTYAQYLQLLDVFGDDGPRLTYADGMVELMAPDFLHEGSSYILGRMVTDLVVELGIPARGLKSSTFTKGSVERGVEPDECFYLTRIEQTLGQGKGNLDLLPPPDLVIEVEITASLLDKLRLYGGLGVPELWRYNGKDLTVLLLQADGIYLPSARSRAFPFLPLAGFIDQLHDHDPATETEWFSRFRAWVREVVLPLHRA